MSRSHRPARRPASRPVRVVAAATIGVLAVLARRAALRWGAREDECAAVLPGDDLIAAPSLTATRATTVGAPAPGVWPWIAQIGQGRGGFYSYAALENLIGCRIHNADAVVPEWQHVAVGDEVRLHPDVALTVAHVQPGRALVLRGAEPLPAGQAPPYDFTWAFVLRPDGEATRLVVRERYACSRPSAVPLVEALQWVSLVMTLRMLRGIRTRAEGAARIGPSVRRGDDPSAGHEGARTHRESSAAA